MCADDRRVREADVPWPRCAWDTLARGRKIIGAVDMVKVSAPVVQRLMKRSDSKWIITPKQLKEQLAFHIILGASENFRRLPNRL